MSDPVITLSRCLHILGAIALFGGAIFTRYVLMPAASELPENEHEKLKSAVTRRWKMFVHLGITVIFFSGFYNYLVVMAPAHKGDGRYHMLMGIKILLAMVVFFIASVLPGRIPAFAQMRRNSKFWLGISILLSTIIVVIAGVLKVRGVPAPVAEKAVPAATAAQ
ncbi:hypothetical protein SH661x_003338 [Planctomicrobium sp. SH661]|uniref:hypothetical protein n=1 Tax=Planctomicrobium sp. SH661 TaxID=3448124 RepID=UPI003F5B4341